MRRATTTASLVSRRGGFLVRCGRCGGEMSARATRAALALRPEVEPEAGWMLSWACPVGHQTDEVPLPTILAEELVA